MNFKQILAGLLAIAAIGVLVFLFQKTQTVDGDLHLERLQRLRAIDNLDVALNRAVSEARVTNMSDVSAIDLLNQGQIYRFITKPISENVFKITVNSAVKQHHKLAQSPVLHQRYQVEKPAVTAPVVATASKLLDRIRSLRSWVSKGSS